MSSRGTPRPPRRKLREEAKLRTRQALIDAALLCFTEQGLDAPSLDAICERAGCTRGAFYVHFADRDALIAAAMEQRRGVVLAALLNVPGGTLSIPKLLELFAAAVARGAIPVPGAVRSAELLAACRRSKTIRDTQRRLMVATQQYLGRQISDDQAQRLVRADAPPAALATLLLMLEAGSELLLDLGVPTDVSGAAQLLSKLISVGQTEP